jgi:lipopolysaccharide transport system ATP-binding protein
MAVIEFQHVSKYFRRHAGQMLLRDRIVRLLRPAPPAEKFYALRDVSFSVEHGQSLAVVGSNGAGKSTLLNITTGLCMPSDGSVKVNGRVAALLELGSGFHPDLTGAENIQVNGALLGLTRAGVRERFDSIVEFSGIGDFINEPQRTYSSGMSMRLAFAVAVNVDPDVLIVDEVLGVGDKAFYQKCLDRIFQFRHAGKSILCVSHSLGTLAELCDHAIWLDHGRLMASGPVKDVVRQYSDMSDSGKAAPAPAGTAARAPARPSARAKARPAARAK